METLSQRCSHNKSLVDAKGFVTKVAPEMLIQKVQQNCSGSSPRPEGRRMQNKAETFRNNLS